MKKISLNGIWKLTGRPQEEPTAPVLSLDATVPGCIQLDLSKAGFLPEDLYMGMNILEAEKFEGYEWWYERTFNTPEERENVYLVLEGVDCIAEYFLNGVKIGDSDNMFIAHEFEIGSALRAGENTLTVHLKSPVIEAHNRTYSVSAMTCWGNAPVETGVRRAPHSYGWDIMPRAVTSGLWRDVRIEMRDKLRFSQLYFRTTDKEATALFEVACKWSDFKDVELELVGASGDSTFAVRKKLTHGKAGSLKLDIKHPKPWFPYGYGDANVYDGTARIYSEGVLVHEEAFSFGLRTVLLDRTDMTDGTSGRFRFLVNGVEILAKGSNWVPLDAFHSCDAERYDKALALVKDIGCNILRCWGGNVYEDHKFFDFCDRNGIMVWQDFAMACRFYPQDEDFRNQLRKEVTAVVRKLRNHPSIVLWAGDNEVDIMLYSKNQNPESNLLTRRLLPEVIAENDLDRPYLPSSPYVCEEIFRTKKMKCIPEDHLWGPRDYYKSDFYKNSNAHFVSETGYHGCPSLGSIKKFITPEKVWPYHNNEEWILHSSDQCGKDTRVMLMEKQVRQLFGEVPTDPEEYILASQISQAEAKKYFIERIRIGRPHKTGIIWWNLLDGWPQMSDAVVDYYFDKKLAYHYIKRSQAPFTIAAGEIENWKIRLYACNDSLTERSGSYTVKDIESGEILLSGHFRAKKNATTVIGTLPIFYSEHRILLIEWIENGVSGKNHYLCGYPPFSLKRYKNALKAVFSEEC